MLTLSDLRQPSLRWLGIYCLLLSPSVVNLDTLHTAVRLKHHRVGAESLLGSRAIVSLQVASAQRGMVCLSMMAAAIWHMTQHQDPSSYSLYSLPKLPSPVSPLASLVHSAPTFAGALGKWLQMKICVLAL